ncbi:MAG: hypothetical protein OEU92_15405 [Alphaproteobacteria bacterium]|nr:hypothetical protein [Alphaproteobacteria bacterium]
MPVIRSRRSSHQQDRLFELIRNGKVGSYNSLRAAATSLLEDEAEVALFKLPDAPTAAERKVVNAVEKRIDQVLGIVQAGFSDGEIVIAQKVDPDRAATSADRLDLIAKHVQQMAEALRPMGPLGTAL